MQGREKDAVIISLVRSNGQREVGFLKDRRRLNGASNLNRAPPALAASKLNSVRAVAMTRAKRHLVSLFSTCVAAAFLDRAFLCGSVSWAIRRLCSTEVHS